MKNKIIYKVFLISFCFFFQFEVRANIKSESMILDNKISEISSNIRCLVCRNQSIQDSNSDFAKDIKKTIEQMLQEGQNEKNIYNYLKSRYGDYILFKPPLQKNTLLLWFLPFIFILFGIIFFTFKYISFREK